MRSRLVSRPSTGAGSILRSPECSTTPCGVRTTVMKPLGVECVTGRNSQSNGPMRAPLVVAHDVQLGPIEQTGLGELVAHQTQRERACRRSGTTSRAASTAPHRCGLRVRACRCRPMMRRAGSRRYEKSGRIVSTPGVSVVAEHLPAVDEQHLAVDLERRAVAADLPEPSEERELDVSGRGASRLGPAERSEARVIGRGRRGSDALALGGRRARGPWVGGSRRRACPAPSSSPSSGWGSGCGHRTRTRTTAGGVGSLARAFATSPAKNASTISRISAAHQCAATLIDAHRADRQQRQRERVVAAVDLEVRRCLGDQRSRSRRGCRPHP